MRHGTDQPLQTGDFGADGLLLGSRLAELGHRGVRSLAALLIGIARDGVVLHVAVGGIERVERFIKGPIARSPRREQLVRFGVESIQPRQQRADAIRRSATSHD